MFISLWTELRDLAHDNKQTISNNTAKLFVNYTIRDLANEYDFEFLRGEKGVTATAGSGLYDLNNIVQPTATTNYLVSAAAPADDGEIIRIFGDYIEASSTLTHISENLTIVGSANVTGAEAFAQVDHITKGITSDTVYVKDLNNNVIATLGANETYLANDIAKIVTVVNRSNSTSTEFYDYRTYQQGNPNGKNQGEFRAYDIDYNNQLRLMNVQDDEEFTLVYQRMPKYLINDVDRSEFPRFLYPAIVRAGYAGWQLRYQDEVDGTQGFAAYKDLLREIIGAWVQGRDQKHAQVIPKWIRRKL